MVAGERSVPSSRARARAEQLFDRARSSGPARVALPHRRGTSRRVEQHGLATRRLAVQTCGQMNTLGISTSPSGPSMIPAPRRALVGVVHQERALRPAQVRMQVAEQRPRAAVGQQPGPVSDVGLEHRADPLPVRPDQPLVAFGQLGRYLRQRFLRPLEELRRAVRPRVIAEHPAQAGPHRLGGRRAHPGQLVIEFWRPDGGRRDEEFRIAGQAVHDAAATPGGAAAAAGPASLAPSGPTAGSPQLGWACPAAASPWCVSLSGEIANLVAARSATSSSSTTSMLLSISRLVAAHQDLAIR